MEQMSYGVILEKVPESKQRHEENKKLKMKMSEDGCKIGKCLWLPGSSGAVMWSVEKTF